MQGYKGIKKGEKTYEDHCRGRRIERGPGLSQGQTGMGAEEDDNGELVGHNELGYEVGAPPLGEVVG